MLHYVATVQTFGHWDVSFINCYQEDRHFMHRKHNLSLCVVLKWLLLCSNEYLCFQKITKLEYMFPDGFPDHAKNLVSEILVSTRTYNSCKQRIDTIKFF